MSTQNTLSLNPQQQNAVDHHSGALLVIAGAGSGKTRVITSRIVSLLTRHAQSAHAIIALTFTNKAANEMKERIARAIGSEQELPFIGTFHSYCVRLLKQYRHLLDKPFISILDDDDQKQMISKILQRNNLQKQISARQVAYAISAMKNTYHNHSKPLALMFDNPLMPDLYLAYEEEKRLSRCFDFDDLLLEAVQLFARNPLFKKEYQEKVRHVLVDEYQDTNVVQHELLKHMSLEDKKLNIDSLCAVGDEDQSIYSWRGATIANMLNFRKDFSDTTVIKIEQNYRSVQPILDTANHIIKHNSQRSAKALWSAREATNRIKKFTCVSEYQEADAIMHLVSIAKKYNKQETIAVLYRTHAQSRVIEESLLRNSIPYKIIGGIQFYERKEIKDLLAYLNLIINRYDRMSFLRIINTPSRHLGEKFEELFLLRWQQEPFLTFMSVAKELLELKELTPQKKKALTSFIELFESIDSQSSPSTILERIITHIGYFTYLKDAHDVEDAAIRTANVKELIDAVKHMETKGITSLEKFLDEVRLMQDLGKSEEHAAHVLLMTLHAAKGLEFDIVIIPGLEQGILPSSRPSANELESQEEERRLFYVGITRARERLLITHSTYRYIYGKMVDQLPSPFLKELPQKGIESLDCSYWNGAAYRQFFANWIDVEKIDPLLSRTLPSSAPAPVYTKPATKNYSSSTLSVKAKPTSEIPSLSNEPEAPFKKNQPVTHTKYGVGLVQKIEQKGNGAWHVTVSFKDGVKNIVSTFLRQV